MKDFHALSAHFRLEEYIPDHPCNKWPIAPFAACSFAGIPRPGVMERDCDRLTGTEMAGCDGLEIELGPQQLIQHGFCLQQPAAVIDLNLLSYSLFII